MTHHDESMVDKARDAIGLDNDDEATSSETEERADGWAGVDDALGGTGDRPAGSIYGSGDVEDADYGETRREHQP